MLWYVAQLKRNGVCCALWSSYCIKPKIWNRRRFLRSWQKCWRRAATMLSKFTLGKSNKQTCMGAFFNKSIFRSKSYITSKCLRDTYLSRWHIGSRRFSLGCTALCTTRFAPLSSHQQHGPGPEVLSPTARFPSHWASLPLLSLSPLDSTYLEGGAQLGSSTSQPCRLTKKPLSQKAKNCPPPLSKSCW